MATAHQYYGGDGAPLEIPADPSAVVSAWRTHRVRLRAWYADLPESGWAAPTRCTGWTAAHMAVHLTSTAQLLGFTLHEARKGKATTLLQGFDAQATPAALVADADKRPPKDLLADWADADGWVDAEVDGLTGEEWNSLAEFPVGHVPAYVSVTHMLFDSWVHERDLLVPVGQTPVTDLTEASIVAGYVFGLAGIVRAADEAPRPDVALQVQLTDLDLVLTVRRAAGHVHVAEGAIDAPVDAAGAASDLVDYATGRHPEGQPMIDAAAAHYLTQLAIGMN